MPVVQNNLRNVGSRHSSTQHLKRKQNKHHQQFFHLISIPVWLLKGHLYRLTGSWINMWRFSLSLRLNAASHCSHETASLLQKKKTNKTVSHLFMAILLCGHLSYTVMILGGHLSIMVRKVSLLMYFVHVIA